MKSFLIRLANGFALEGVKGFAFTISNSIFDTEFFRGQFSQGISIPKTDGNVANLGFYHLPEIDIDMSASIDVVTEFEGYKLPSSLVIISADETSYRATVLLGFSKILDDLEKTKLSDADLENIGLIEHPFMDLEYTEIADNFDMQNDYASQLGVLLGTYNETAHSNSIFCFPHFQRGGTSLTDPRHLNKVELEVDDLEETYSFGLQDGGGICPAFFVFKLLRHILAAKNIEMNGPLLDVPFIDRVITFGTKEIPNERGTVFYTEGAGAYGKYCRFPEEFNPNECLSDISVLDVLKKLKSHFSIPLWMDFNVQNLHLETWDSVLDDQTFVDWTDKWERWIEIKDGKLQGLDLDYDIENDDWAAKSIPTKLEEYTLKGNKPTYDSLASVVNPQPKDAWFVEELAMYYVPEFDEQGVLVPAPSWKPLGYKVNPVKTGKEQLQRKFILPTLDDNATFQVYSTNEDVPAYQGNRVNLFEFYSNHRYMKPNLSYNSNDNKEFRIAHWLGKVYADVEDIGLYYFAANSVGEPINWGDFYNNLVLPKPDFTLWIGPEEGRPSVNKEGVWQKFGARFAAMMEKTKKQRGRFRLTASDIMELRSTRKIRVGNNLYFFDNIKGSLPIESSVEVDLYWLDPFV